MELIGGKWTSVILAQLKQRPLRFSELRRLIPDVSEKMLTQRLRQLEGDGLVTRSVLSSTPPHVSYDLSDEGRSLAPVLLSLFEWGERRAEAHSLVIEATSADLDGKTV